LAGIDAIPRRCSPEEPEVHLTIDDPLPPHLRPNWVVESHPHISTVLMRALFIHIH
jgi:hypothetical protein